MKVNEFFPVLAFVAKIKTDQKTFPSKRYYRSPNPFQKTVLTLQQKQSVSSEIETSTSIETTSSTGSISGSNKYDQLLDWLRSRNGSYVNEHIVLKPSDRGGGYGAFIVNTVNNDDNDNDHDDEKDGGGRPASSENTIISPLIDTGDLLFVVPRCACVTLRDALDDPSYGQGFHQIIEKAGPGGNTVVLAGYIAAEWYKCIHNIESSSLSLSASQFGPFLATVPWSRGVNSQEHILYWNDEQIESNLKGSMCYGEALELRKEVKLATKVINTIIGRARAQEERSKDDTFRWPWEKKEVTPIGEIEGLAEIITGTFVSILTRAFEDDFGNQVGDPEKLVPLLDMLQHSDQPNVAHSMRIDNGAVEVRARTPFYGGEELLNQYRSEMEESMPYHRFFTRFGFVPGITEPIPNLLRDKSSIFYAQKAEV